MNASRPDDGYPGWVWAHSTDEELWPLLPHGLSGIFPLRDGRLIISWSSVEPQSMREDTCCFHCFMDYSCCCLCLCCAPCCIMDMIDNPRKERIEYLVLAPSQDGGRAVHIQAFERRGGFPGRLVRRREFSVAHAALMGDRSYSALNLYAPPPGLSNGPLGYRESQSTEPELEIPFSHWWHSQYGAFKRTNKATDPDGYEQDVQLIKEVSTSAADAALHHVNLLLSGRSLSPKKWMAASSPGWRCADPSQWASLHEESQEERLIMGDPPVVLNGPSGGPRSWFQCLICSVLCPCCIPCHAESCVRSRQDFFRFAVSTDGIGLELEESQAPDCPICTCICPREPASQTRGPFKVADVVPHSGGGLLVRTSQHALLHVALSEYVVLPAYEVVQKLLTEYGFSRPGTFAATKPQDLMANISRRPSVAFAAISRGLQDGMGKVRTYRSSVHSMSGEHSELTGVERAASSARRMTARLTTSMSRRSTTFTRASTVTRAGSLNRASMAETGADQEAMVEMGNALLRRPSSSDAKAVEELVSCIRAAYGDDAVDAALERFVSLRGASAPSPLALVQVLAAAPTSQQARVVDKLANRCGGPWPASLTAAAVSEVQSKFEAEPLAMLLARHVIDPEKFEALVIDDTRLKNIGPAQRAQILKQLPDAS